MLTLPLEKLDTLAGQIGNFGTAAAVATFVALIIMRFYRPDLRNPQDNLVEHIVKSFIIAVTIVVVAVPEGLPLAVTLSLAYSTKQMMNDNNLIRVLEACETMGNATNICSDKTGTLTQNRMTVVDAWVAGEPLGGDLAPKVSSLVSEGIAVNSTAVLVNGGNDGMSVLGNKTEGALLLYLREFLNVDYAEVRSKGFDMSRGDRLFSFSSSRKRMSVLVLVNAEEGRLYTKGAAEIILDCCDRYLSRDGQELPLDKLKRQELLDWIAANAQRANRCLAIGHRAVPVKDFGASPETLENKLVLDAVFGIKDPLRPDVTAAVRTCQQAGVFVRMITGDNIETAKAIAKECGILTEDGVALEGPAFRKMTPAELDKVLPRLQVIGRCSPDDKYILVNRLNGAELPETPEEWALAHPGANWDTDKDILLPGYHQEWKAARDSGVGDVVGVTGDGTNDAPALKVADVGLSMGISGTEGESDTIFRQSSQILAPHLGFEFRISGIF